MKHVMNGEVCKRLLFLWCNWELSLKRQREKKRDKNVGLNRSFLLPSFRLPDIYVCIYMLFIPSGAVSAEELSCMASN